ncbi:MAG: hypothetical protein GXX96_01750 [Planctomycetaceae bacterium]|nr:hypothetical protein [Planctomycetaceae bacterium]
MGDATTRQKQYLRRLGHKEVGNLTKEKASELIEELLEVERRSGKQFACPYCNGKFGPRPKSRKKKCPNCGKTFYHIVGKFYTADGVDKLNQEEWYKESRDMVKDSVREDWKEENEYRRQFKEQDSVGYLVKAGPNCPHAANVDGLLVLLEDAKKHPEMLPPYEECRYNTCECEFDLVSADEVPRKTRVAQLSGDPTTGGGSVLLKPLGCSSILKLSILACGLLVFVVFCAGILSGRNDTPPAPRRSSAPSRPAQAVSRPTAQLPEDVVININEEVMPDRRVVIRGTTNLPTGTTLMFDVSADGKMLGQDKQSVGANGEFESEPFGPSSGYAAGDYSANVMMPIARLQPQSVQAVIGKNGEHLRGSLVEDGEFGTTVKASKPFTIAGPTAPAAAPINNADYRQAYNQADALFQEVDAMRKANANPVDWAEFLRSVNERAAIVTKPLKDAPIGSAGRMILAANPAFVALEANPHRTTYSDENFRAVRQTAREYMDRAKALIEEAGGQVNGPAPTSVDGKAFRTWTDASGRFQIDAAFGGYAAGTVTLRRADNSTIKVQMDSLCDEDQQWIRDRGKR